MSYRRPGMAEEVRGYGGRAGIPMDEVVQKVTAHLIVFGGGFPIMVDGQIIGGISVSGGRHTHDMEVAVHRGEPHPSLYKSTILWYIFLWHRHAMFRIDL
jgi:hypothetical protein